MLYHHFFSLDSEPFTVRKLRKQICVMIDASVQTRFSTRTFAITSMPRENRKRGKRHKKSSVEVEKSRIEINDAYEQGVELEAGPSWIVGKSTYSQHEVANLDAPFGFVDPDLKAYFRTVDAKLKEWQELGRNDFAGKEDETDPNEGELAAFISSYNGK